MMRRRPSRRGFLKLAGTALAAGSLSENSLFAYAQPDARSLKLNHTLWFDQPAAEWADALPLGNGRLGAMVFGGVARERIALNEDTLWSGAPKDWNNPDAPKHLPVVRELVLGKQDYKAADSECKKMQGPFTEAYEPLGDLTVDLVHGDAIVEYRRELDLDGALSRVTYRVDGERYTRETFVSYPAQVVVVRLETTAKAGLTATVKLSSRLRAKTEFVGSDGLRLTGKAPFVSDPNYLDSADPVRYSEKLGEGMHFAASLRATVNGGTVAAGPDGGLKIAGATSAVLLVGMATGYKGYAVAPDMPLAEVVAKAEAVLSPAAKVGYRRLYEENAADHQKFYRRAALELDSIHVGETPSTDRRVKGFEKEPDPALAALYFNYGRYMLLTSSQPGTQPANLQGIWNAEVRPPWSCNWTSNINVQMNYWPVETCNLSECHGPLFDMVTDLSRNGATTAKVNYGADGWVSHHNIDIWRHSGPVGMGIGMADPTWANFCMSGPWLCQHFMEHYRFTGDKEFLRTSYPVLKGAAEFCLSWLIEDGKGHLTTCPSVSTENSFLTPDGKHANVSAGCTMDLALIRELFGNVVEAGRILGMDSEFAGRLEAAVKRLPPYQIGRWGQLQEWSVDFEEDQPEQRHMSHLYPVYPGAEITPRNNPKLAAAARASLQRRLDHGGAYTGWSRAWAIGLWARLVDGEKAWESIRLLMQHSTGINLFDSHPAKGGAIFQIDGNFGATAAMAELMVQSHDGEITLVPALPKAWKSGSVRGLRARGGLEVSAKWSGGVVGEVHIVALHAGKHMVRLPPGHRLQGAVTGMTNGAEPGLMTFQAEASRRYTLRLISA